MHHRPYPAHAQYNTNYTIYMAYKRHLRIGRGPAVTRWHCYDAISWYAIYQGSRDTLYTTSEAKVGRVGEEGM
jgi:hypothetical protein